MSKKEKVNNISQNESIDEMLDKLSSVSDSKDRGESTEDYTEAVPFGTRVKAFFKNENGERTRTIAKIKAYFKSSRAKHGSMAVVITVVFLVLVILLNIIASALVDRYPLLNLDMTKEGTYSLSDSTVSILKSLDEDIAIIILASEEACTSPSSDFDPYNQIPQAHELIMRYAAYSEHISIEHVDLTRTPQILNEGFLSEYSSELADYSIIVLNKDTGRVRVTSFYEMLPYLQYVMDSYYYDVSVDDYEISSSYAESALTSAIRTVVIERDTLPVVAYINDIEADSECAYFLSSLSENGYELKEMSMNEDIPENAEILVLPAPREDISAWLSARIEEWLYNNGRYGRTLIVFTIASAPQMPQLNALLENWGMVYTSDIVYESESSYVVAGSSLDSYFHAQYADSVFTSDISESGKNTRVIMANNIEFLFDSSNEKTTNAILTTTSGGYACASADEYDTAKANGTGVGTKTVMAISSQYGTNADGEEIQSSIVLAPASIYSTDVYSSSQYGNFTLMMSICDEFTGMGDMVVDIQAKYLSDVDFSIDDSALTLITVILTIAVPLIVLGLGIFVYVRRRFL